MPSLATPTVLVVTPDQTRTVCISPRLLYAAKPLLAALSAAAVLLSLGLGVLGWNYFSIHQRHAAKVQQLQQQVTHLENYTSAEVAAKLAALQKSEQMVFELQKYLSARGIHVKPAIITPVPGKPVAAAGGPLHSNKGAVAFTGNFAGEAQSMLQAIERTPLGVPHGGALTSLFGGRANPFSGRGSEDHGGIDFKGTTGDPIRATATGKIAFAGVQGGYGNVVRIDHGNGYETIFAHLSEIKVQAGNAVKSGDVVGLLGSTGRSTGPHLHYEVRRNGERLDPEMFLSLNVPFAIPNS